MRNLRISVLAFLAMIGMLICIMGTLSVAGVTLGVVEALCFAVIVGISVDYIIHFSHLYNHSVLRTRYLRSRSSLLARFSSVASAATTTVGAVLVLFGCKLQ